MNILLLRAIHPTQLVAFDTAMTIIGTISYGYRSSKQHFGSLDHFLANGFLVKGISFHTEADFTALRIVDILSTTLEAKATVIIEGFSEGRITNNAFLVGGHSPAKPKSLVPK